MEDKALKLKRGKVFDVRTPKLVCWRRERQNLNVNSTTQSNQSLHVLNIW